MIIAKILDDRASEHEKTLVKSLGVITCDGHLQRLFARYFREGEMGGSERNEDRWEDF